MAAPGRAPVVILAIAAWSIAGLLARGAEAAPSGVDDCMECHDGADDETVSFPDGTKLSVGIDRKLWDGSVHAGQLVCVDCHRRIADHPHPTPQARSARSYQQKRAESCRRCHYEHYTRALDGIHYKLMAAGNDKAPNCVDCHGAHDTTDPSTPRITVARRCARCHAKIAKIYEQSVHGKALVDHDNGDVPVCTDCHGAHAIKDPRKQDYRVRQHLVCAKCHSDEKRMDKYGISVEVVDSYLVDFHGRSNALYAMGAGIPSKPMATCSDCHGIHDIVSLKHEKDQAAVKKRVSKVCRKCHHEVPAGFADAWLSHYRPTLASAPLVWGVTWLYRILIPVIMTGLVLHILLHLWRIRGRR